MDRPVFVMTTDIDWASDYAIDELVGFLEGRGVPVTAFVTHDSPTLRRARDRGAVELGLHPNFLPNSSHGADVASVIDHAFSLVPDAVCFRSHAMVDSSPISMAMAERGIRYDSNLALYMQPGLVPLRHWIGIPRYPIFWADDCHWRREGTTWDFSRYADQFFTPGLKIISTHPFMFALNIPDMATYLRDKSHITSLDAATADRLRHHGLGVRSFIESLVDEVKRRGHSFISLSALHDAEWAR